MDFNFIIKNFCEEPTIIATYAKLVTSYTILQVILNASLKFKEITFISIIIYSATLNNFFVNGLS